MSTPPVSATPPASARGWATDVCASPRCGSGAWRERDRTSDVREAQSGAEMVPAAAARSVINSRRRINGRRSSLYVSSAASGRPGDSPLPETLNVCRPRAGARDAAQRSVQGMCHGHCAQKGKSVPFLGEGME